MASNPGLAEAHAGFQASKPCLGSVLIGVSAHSVSRHCNSAVYGAIGWTRRVCGLKRQGSPLQKRGPTSNKNSRIVAEADE